MWGADQVTPQSVAQTEEKGEDRRAVERAPGGSVCVGGPQEAPHTAWSVLAGKEQKEGPLVTVGTKES